MVVPSHIPEVIWRPMYPGKKAKTTVTGRMRNTTGNNIGYRFFS